MIATTANLESLAAALDAEAGFRTELTQFPSGAAMLDVRSPGGRNFVLAYSPRHGYSVDELCADEAFTSGYRYTYPDLAAAAGKLRELLDSAAGGTGFG